MKIQITVSALLVLFALISSGVTLSSAGKSALTSHYARHNAHKNLLYSRDSSSSSSSHRSGNKNQHHGGHGKGHGKGHGHGQCGHCHKPSHGNTSGLSLRKEYKGEDILDKNQWDYFTGEDPTHGYVNFLTAEQAKSSNLAYVNKKGGTVLAVDTKKNLGAGQYRDSVRISSKDTIQNGDLLILDASHMPTGCATWPAFWLLGIDGTWPNAGEIDIVENVNEQTNGQYTLHTTAGCTTNNQGGSGELLKNNCDVAASDNEGCGVKDQDTSSFGPGFNKNQGGVHALYWTDDGISIWFFPRDDVPKDIQKGNPDPSSWGNPKAMFSSDSCDLEKYFKPQQIIINITLCGDWAGATYNQNGCPGSCEERIQKGSNFKDAYWEINSISVYSSSESSKSSSSKSS